MLFSFNYNKKHMSLWRNIQINAPQAWSGGTSGVATYYGGTCRKRTTGHEARNGILPTAFPVAFF